MNPKILAAAFICLSFNAAIAQQNMLSFSLYGTLGVQGGEVFDYTINATDSATYIKGYAITSSGQGQDTRALITGRINKAAGILSFQEIEITENKGFNSLATLCLIKATLEYKKDDGGKNYILTGPIQSTDIGNYSCAGGSILFANGKAIRPLFDIRENDVIALKPSEKTAAVIAKDTAIAPPKPERKVVYVYDTARKVVATTTKIEKQEVITSGKEKRIKWKSDSVHLEVWDGGTIDGDVISIILNDRPVSLKLRLEAKPTVFVIPLSNYKTTNNHYNLSILAESEGNEPPNTANIKLRDGEKEYNVIANNEYGREALIELVKE